MISKAVIKAWLEAFPDDAGIAVDDGGLTLVALTPDGEELGYYEVGGIPLPEEEDE